MNNYNNMNYFLPNDFGYMDDLQSVYEQTQFLNSQMGLNQNGQMVQNGMGNNVMKDQKLAAKLKKQAGDNMNFNVSNYEQDVNAGNIYDPYNAFIRGNLFPDLYNTYKVSKPYDIKPANAQAELLTKIDAYCFAAHELNLYLDNNPNDRDAITLFKKYTDESNAAINEYEQKYGPLFVDASTTYPWAWNESPWPWENK